MSRCLHWLVIGVVVLTGCQAAGGGGPGPQTPSSPQPKLVVSSINVPATVQTTSSTWTLGTTITNSGTADAGSFTLEYRISTSSTLDGTAVLIGTKTISALAAGAAHADVWSTSYSIASSYATPQGGTHWIFVTLDATVTASAAVPVTYPRVVIETYDPTDGGVVTVPFISLFNASGDTTADTSPNEWNDDQPPFTVDTGVAIAESGTSGTWESIDYQGGLAPGVYYVRIRGAQSYATGPYAVRFLSLNVGDALPTYSYFGVTNSADSPYESDDAVVSGVPTNPVGVSPGSVLNRFLTNSDMDWFRLTLP